MSANSAQWTQGRGTGSRRFQVEINILMRKYSSRTYSEGAWHFHVSPLLRKQLSWGKGKCSLRNPGQGVLRLRLFSTDVRHWQPGHKGSQAQNECLQELNIFRFTWCSTSYLFQHPWANKIWNLNVVVDKLRKRTRKLNTFDIAGLVWPSISDRTCSPISKLW